MIVVILGIFWRGFIFYKNILTYFSVDKDRIAYFDIAKAIGIILVVWGHCHGPFTNYIYQFHMPLFFLISGLLYSKRSNIKDFIVRKVHNLYIPFVFWNILFIIPIAFYKDYKFISFIKRIILVLLTLDKEGIFLGAIWFLGALFLISILYKILESSFKDSVYKDIFLLVIFGVLVIIGFKFTLPYKLSRTLILGLFYAIGAYIKVNRNSISTKLSSIPFKKYHLVPILAGIVFIIIGSFNSADMSSNTFTSPLLFIIGALCASYCLIYLCKLMENIKVISSIKESLMSIGQHSIDIVIWQFVFFYPVVILQLIFYNEKVTLHKIFLHPTYITTNGWWIVYLLVGVFVSLIWGYILRQGIWGKLLKKIHVVN